MARAEDGFFDDLARGLADGTLTRGKALRLMGAAVVGGTLGSLGMGEASADPPGCKRNGKTCTRGTQCCSGNCSGGTCQAQTTTTTTTTPTTTTSTTTPTTSTSTTPGCLPTGSSTPCTDDSQCCSGICNPSGTTSGFCSTCRSPGGACGFGVFCCEVAGIFTTCQRPSQFADPICCNSPGASCATNAQCCPGTGCVNGVCRS